MGRGRQLFDLRKGPEEKVGSKERLRAPGRSPGGRHGVLSGASVPDQLGGHSGLLWSLSPQGVPLAGWGAVRVSAPTRPGLPVRTPAPVNHGISSYRMWGLTELGSPRLQRTGAQAGHRLSRGQPARPRGVSMVLWDLGVHCPWSHQLLPSRDNYF